MTGSPRLCVAIKLIFWITSQTLGVLLVYVGLRDFCGTAYIFRSMLPSLRQEPTFIKIKINIKLTNEKEIVMLSHKLMVMISSFDSLKQLKHRQSTYK